MKHLNWLEYWLRNFSFTSMVSWDTSEFSRVLSSMRERSPSCWIAISGFDLNASSANALDDDPSTLESNTDQYPSKSFWTMFSTVDLPLPGGP